MNKFLFYLSLLMLGLAINSCQNEELVMTNKNMGLDRFSNMLEKYNQKIIPIVNKAETRSNGKYIELTKEEKVILESEYKTLAKHSKELFITIGFTEKELNEIYCKSNTDDIAIAAFFYSTFTNSVSESRALTANVYVDCALAVAGFNLFDCIESGGKAMAKQMMKTMAKKMFGPVGAALTIAEYVLCVGGIG